MTRTDGSPLLTWLERLLLTGGAGALLWCTFLVADAFLIQRSAHLQLEAMRQARTRTASPIPPETARVAETPPSSDEARFSPPAIVRPSERPPTAALGELSIPRLNFSAVVFEGSDDRTLRFGLGHLEQTALPGDAGNVAIAGHRDSFFRSLHDLQEGDDIWVDTVDQRVHYRVAWLRVVDPREVSVLDPTSEPALTLVTCFPFQFIGAAPYRFVVRAARVEEGQKPD